MYIYHADMIIFNNQTCHPPLPWSSEVVRVVVSRSAIRQNRMSSPSLWYKRNKGFGDLCGCCPALGIGSFFLIMIIFTHIPLANKWTSEFSTRDRTVFKLDNLFFITSGSLSKTSCFLNWCFLLSAFTNGKKKWLLLVSICKLLHFNQGNVKICEQKPRT